MDQNGDYHDLILQGRELEPKNEGKVDDHSSLLGVLPNSSSRILYRNFNQLTCHLNSLMTITCSGFPWKGMAE
jgi:hypothetical protein